MSNGGGTANGIGDNAPWWAKLWDHTLNAARSLGTTNVLLLGLFAWMVYLAPGINSWFLTAAKEASAQTILHQKTEDSLAKLSECQRDLSRGLQSVLQNQASIITLESAALENHAAIMEAVGSKRVPRRPEVRPAAGRSD